jgi:UDP-N-acetylmuramoyl-L-alanine---L-glutamate ligase
LIEVSTLSAGLESFRIHRTAIWGFGREGQAALHAIRAIYPEKRLALIISPEEAEAWDFSTDPNLEVITSEATAGLLGQYGTIIKSPGISPYSASCDWARFRGTRIISGSSIWFAEHPHEKTICITGTKGKSTVSALVAHLLRAAGQRTALCGNIGMPLLELMHPDPAPDWWVIELSSYQTTDFMGVPAVACILNLFPEHLPWHGSEERYYQDKVKILANGKADVAVLNGADDRLVEMTQFVERGYYFNTTDSWHVRDTDHAEAGTDLGMAIYFADERVLGAHDLRLKGRHNAQNVCAALMIVQAAGFDAKALAKQVRSFHALPHRLQNLGVRGGYEFIDDSIATTPHASVAALEALEGTTTILVGGFDRGLSWEHFVDYVQANPVHAVLASGANAALIADAFAKRMRIVAPSLDQPTPPGSVAFAKLETLEQAIELAMRITPRGGNILLSPGAPSFDQYSSYAERGRAFARLSGFGELSEEEISGLGVL